MKIDNNYNRNNYLNNIKIKYKIINNKKNNYNNWYQI